MEEEEEAGYLSDTQVGFFNLINMSLVGGGGCDGETGREGRDERWVIWSFWSMNKGIFVHSIHLGPWIWSFFINMSLVVGGSCGND